ncbi:MAG: class I SAM-dependent methyltransferase [Gammaproteobacteria bacterium]|nr:class I SAM-dependent methyltransferase [Gammaproteobacteria bacterium]
MAAYLTDLHRKLLWFRSVLDPRLTTWLNSPRGRTLLDTEVRVTAESLEDCFGWETLQIGVWGETRTLIAHARTRSQTVLDIDSTQDLDAVGRPSQLPIANDCIDVVLLAHALEFESDPYGLVREADRVLAGEGKLLVLGFSPMSFWGLRARASRHGFPPGLRRVLPERRVRDWLHLLGYDVLGARRYLYGLPWGEPASVDHQLRRGWLAPWPSGAYLLKARKSMHALTPLRPRPREARRSRVLGGLTEPSVNRDPS